MTDLFQNQVQALQNIQNAPSQNAAMAELYHNEIKDSDGETSAKNRVDALIHGLESPSFVAQINTRQPQLEQTRKALISKLKQFSADGFFVDLDKILAVYFPKPYATNQIIEPKELIRKKTTFRVQAVRSEFDKENEQEFGRTVIDENVTYDGPGQKMMNDIYEVESMLAMFSNKKRDKVFEETFTVRENIPFFKKNGSNQAPPVSTSITADMATSDRVAVKPAGTVTATDTPRSIDAIVRLGAQLIRQLK